MGSYSQLPALDIKPPESPLDTYARIAGIKSLLTQQQAAQQQMQQSQQEFPARLQQEQSAAQQAGTQAQMSQLDLQDRQGLSKALMDSYAPQPAQPSLQGAPSEATPAGEAAPAAPSGSAQDRYSSFLQKVQDPKYGISAAGQFQVMQQFNGMREQIAKTDKATLDATQSAQDQFAQSLQSVLQAPPEDRPLMWQLQVNKIRRDPTLSKYAQNVPPQYPGDQMAQSTLAHLLATKDFIDVAKTGAQLPGMEAESKEKTLEAAAPTMQQIQDATKTISTYEGISPAERQGLIAEVQHAPDWATVQKVQARADAAQSSGEMKQATLAQARAMMGNKFGEAGLTNNEKIWTDPQRGYATALAQANQTKDSIKAGADGNGLLTSLAPTMEVLGINHAAGMNRIQPQEAEAARVPGEWATRWNAWATKAMTGKLTPELARQGQQLMDVVVDAAYQRSLQSSQLIAKGHGLDYSQTPAMTKDGQITTLDQVMGKSTWAQSQIPAAVAKALSGVGAGIHTLSDGSKWQKDANGNITKQ